MAGHLDLLRAGINQTQRAPLGLAALIGAGGLGDPIVAGLAPSMELLVAGRAVQGLGADDLVLRLYMLGAREAWGIAPRGATRSP